MSEKEKLVVIPCFVGESCWCRMIAYESYLKDKRKKRKLLVDAGCIHKTQAEYLVKTYNQAIKVWNRRVEK